MLLVLFSLFLASGFEATKLDNKNITIDCSFNEISTCLNMIATLGGNFSSSYDQKDTDMNRTCSQTILNPAPNLAFLSCLGDVPSKCQRVGQQPEIDNIGSLAKKLCKNGTVEQINFLNSSVCYNQNRVRRQNCVKHYSTTKVDAKSRCCQSKKIQECLKKDMASVCPKNYTDFQNRLIDTYSSYTNKLCADYNQHCGAAVHTLSVVCLFLALKSVYLNNWHMV